MTYQKKLFEQYHRTRSVFLDSSDQEKLAWFAHYFQHLYQPHIKHMSKDSAILELGCNKGYLLKTLLKNGYHTLTGVDLSPESLKIAARIIPEATLVYQDAFDFLDEHPASYDLIILKALIEHIQKDKILIFLEKIANALRPQGRVLIDVQNSDWLFGLHDRYVDFTHEAGFTKESLRQIMLITFDNVNVIPTERPLWKMSRKATIRHRFAKKFIYTLLRWAEPDAPCFNKRTLIGLGTKRSE